MNKAIVVLNEQHTLLPEQEKILNDFFDKWEIFSVPASGWTYKEMQEIAKEIGPKRDNIVFASPIPALMKLVAKTKWWTFHNDNREKKELPNGKIIMTVAKTGWQLV